ncbi:DICT sensory domain-containing protein [Halorussus amylolyticus]|uniref:DICT sensory domain-containing protein n=1 Tax=Halorussus amylolyticus TaxID=1126242 RepID=UPI0010505B36|nr:DICT sensory domain-containing protein [Halorussus amylolyticus]
MLRSFLDEVASRRKTVTVFAPDRLDGLESQFETRNVAVEHADLPDDGSGGFVVVTEGGEFLGSVGAAAVRELLEPSVSHSELRGGGTRLSETGPPEAVRALLDLLADTTFVSFDKRQMLAVSREIEDRAYRRGTGTLRTGFQRPAAFAAQRERYELLAAESLLDVHVYARPDWPPDVPVSERITVHTDTAAEIGAFWFVVFDGGGDDYQACALVAEEVDESGTFRGLWTYDPETVTELDAYLESTYP